MSANSSPAGNAPKAMSSRLLTMKFMQRAAASPTTPTTSTTTPEEPSSKRRKLNSSSKSPSKSKINIDELANQRAVQAAIAIEEAKREKALERQAAEAGDTKWVLDLEHHKALIAAPKLAIRVVQAGYANLDAPDTQSVEEDSDLEVKPVMVGRRSFGKFNKTLEKQQDPTTEDSSSGSDSSGNEDDSDKSSSENDEDDGDPTTKLINSYRLEAAERLKAERNARKKAEKAQSIELARQRKKKEIKLNGDVNLDSLTSLSGRQETRPSISCFQCGGPHLKRECPNNKRPFDGGDRGFSKKARNL